jgi:hypothetical protein
MRKKTGVEQELQEEIDICQGGRATRRQIQLHKQKQQAEHIEEGPKPEAFTKRRPNGGHGRP